MKTLLKALALIIAIISILFVFLAGSVFGMHTIFEKENISKILEQYLLTSAKTDEGTSDALSAYTILDSGDSEGISSLISSPDFSSLFEYYGSISDISELSSPSTVDLSQAGGGFMSIFSSFSTIISVMKGESGLISLMLNLINAGSLLSKNVLNKAFEDTRLSSYPNDYAGKASFLHTKLATQMTLEAAFVYFNYFKSEATAENWQANLRVSLLELQNEREQDLSLLIGHGVTASDKEYIAALKDSLSDAVIAGMIAPDVKADELSGTTRMLLNLFFSDSIVILLSVLALINLSLIFVILSDFRKGSAYAGVVLILSGLMLMLFKLFKTFVIGPFYSDEGSGINAMQIFLIVGGIVAFVGLLVALIPSIVNKMKAKKIKGSSDINSAVPSFGELQAITELNLGDLVTKNNRQIKQADGTIDYYGDGRGLNAQREYLKSRNKNANNDSVNDNSADNNNAPEQAPTAREQKENDADPNGFVNQNEPYEPQ